MEDVSHNVMKLSKNDPKTLNVGFCWGAPCAQKKHTTLKFFKITSFYWLLRNKNVQEHIKDIL